MEADYLRARRRGGSDTDCAYMAGIHPDTVRKWRHRYEACDPQLDHDTGRLGTYADDEGLPTIPDLFTFFEADKKAIAEARIERLAHIELAGSDGTWTAAAWWLERRYPDEYGRRERRDVTVTSTGILTVETTGEVDADDSDRLEAIAGVLSEVLEHSGEA
jgi:hypothetical protein